MHPVAQHYARFDLLDRIWEGLKAHGKDLQSLTVEDLAPVDEFHIRGREATLELARLADVQSHWRVLDLGSGLGGSSRVLASEYGCKVTGIDLTPDYCEAATALSKAVGLERLTEFRCGSALATPFGDGAFDLVWTQHVQMNIAEKGELYHEVARVLEPGGRFVFHDLLAGPGGAPHFPAHWAEESRMSHLIAPDGLRALLEREGFRVLAWRDVTEVSREWYLAGVEQRRRNGSPPVGLHLLMGETAEAKFENVARSLREDRLTVYQGLLERI